MRPPITALLLLQLGAGAAAHQPAEPKYLRYQRAVERIAGAAGQTCVALDAAVLEHEANRGGSDLRLYAQGAAGERETPFLLTESSSDGTDPETIAVSGEQVHGNVAEFDLRMPARPYSEIDLDVHERDFIAKAEVVGGAERSRTGQSLGTVTLFDLSSQGLPRSTQLRLGESTFPWVHIRLQFSDLSGRPLRSLGAPVVTDALLPPSRQAQVLYTTVAEARDVTSQGTSSVAELRIAAHVPVERVRVELDPQFRSEFLRGLVIDAGARATKTAAADEVVKGTIGRVSRPDPGPGVPPIHFEELAVSAALGSNLRDAATVRVSVLNGASPPLPIRAVLLEMRRRSVCFEAAASATYFLRYGDEALAAPVYADAQSFRADARASTATLGPEGLNAAYVVRGRGWAAGRPELLWVGLLAAVTLVGAAVVERLRRHGARR